MRKIRHWLKRIFLKKWGPEVEVEISLLFVTDRYIQTLNKKFRDKNKPTDVLAFPLRDAVSGGHLGDIVISPETAYRNAKAYGRLREDEIKFLLIHGFLHLLGYDHEISRKEEIRMQQQEKRFWKWLED